MSALLQLRESFKLALAMTLFYWLALRMNWDQPQYGALAIIVVSLGTTGASLNKGVMRVAGTGLGALAGFVLLSWFAQSPVGMLLGVSLYLVVVAYLMQTSRQADVWFNAGFIAIAVWSSSYLRVDTAFHFATTRFLETAAGVVVFTLVSALLWPRTSRNALHQQGRTLWQQLRALFGRYRRQLLQGEATADTAKLRTAAVGTFQQLLATLDAAYADTPAIAAQKPVWERLRTSLRVFGNAQELWHESIDDCRELDLRALLPGLGEALQRLDARLEAGEALWQAPAGETTAAADSGPWLAPLDLHIEETAAATLSHSRRAALLNFLEQLKALDHSSLQLLRVLRILAGLEPAEQVRTLPLAGLDLQPLRWNPERLLRATFPALCWIAAFAFWIHVQPPGGPAIPMMAAAFGLVVVMAPVKLLALLLLLLLSMLLVVAPVYLLLMPQLESGQALLALIFLYTFVFGYLGGRSPALKLGPLMMFVMLANIGNEQSYSFMLLVNAGLMMLLGVGIVVLVQRLLSPMHPEKVLLRTLRRFFQGCARIIDSYSMGSPQRHATSRRVRRRLFESRIQPLTAQLQMVSTNLDYRQFPHNDERRVTALLHGLYSLRNRLQLLETNWERTARRSPGLLQLIQPLQGEWRRRMRAVFRRWARLQSADRLIESWRHQPGLARELEDRLDELERHGIDEGEAQSLYALIGSIDSLLEAMAELQRRMHAIDWKQWSAERF
ncbi:MAG TPA: hypothetical protein ENK05_14535 [Gammaproteobacteria bacterium]|nr:hypothetical protein [Gammaproteobacteria bacterium]